jgi:LysM repeat protein/3D (Asp-Asp-Asp) domain-containing protein
MEAGMYRKYSLFLLFLFGTIESVPASERVTCQIMTQGTTACNPYGHRLIRAKELVYNRKKQKLIVTKTLPLPGKKPKITTMSIADMIEDHIKVEDSLRFRGTAYPPVESMEGKETVTEQISAKIRAEEERRKKERAERERLAKEKREKEEREKEQLRREAELQEVQRKLLEKREKEKKAVLERAREEMRLAREAEQKRGFYKVKKGDTLSTIASRYGMKTRDLMAMNQLDEKATIRSGAKLLMPFPQTIIDAIAAGSYKVESDDTLISIARKFNMKPKDVAQFNHLDTTMIVRVGKVIQLPFPERLKEAKAKKKKGKTKKRLAAASRKKEHSRLIHRFGKHKLRVTATAYTSHGTQTDKTPFLAAWNNRIRPGMKIIAVSRDLLSKYKLKNGSKVRIAGLPGIYRVRDKMNKRYKKRIDIYMGMNRRKALRWGRRSVILYW